VTHGLARTLSFSTFAVLVFGLLSGPSTGTPPTPEDPPRVAPVTKPEKVVFLGSDMSAENLVTFTATVAASGHPGVVLQDSPKLTPYTKAFLKAFQPQRVYPVGAFPDGKGELEKRLGVKVMPTLAWKNGQPRTLWRELFPKAKRVVVCPAEPRGQFLQAACLAGVLRAPLFVTHGKLGEAEELKERLVEWKTEEVFAAGNVGKISQKLTGVRVIRLWDEAAVAASYLRHQLKDGPIQTLVVANPADNSDELGGMASLAPWIALQRRAALLLTNPAGDNAEKVVKKALADPHLRDADVLLLVAGLKAVPMCKRRNPIPTDKDPEIEMEPFTPTGSEPFTFATGRVFHDEIAVVPLLFARERLLTERRTPRKALVASNAGGGLPLLETFSRNTIQEFKNAGYQTRALLGKDVTKDDVRRLMQEHDIFLWEGHCNTLIRDYSMPEWDEPMRPSLVFLQSCLALQDWKAQPLLQRGAVGVIGTSTRMYSASGGACSLAFFNALFYEDASLGSALRQSKNFLLAYSILKDKRLGKDAKRTGANVRAAWAFTLWGDPTVKLPRPPSPDKSRPAVQHVVQGRNIVLQLPPATHEKVKSGKYEAQLWPNGRFAGLLVRVKEAEGEPLVPLVFAEVHLPHAPAGQTPSLRTRLPSNRWVFTWDARRRVGYVVATPRASDKDELRFRVEWQSENRVMNDE
jgi:hypothetical protein